MNGRKIISLLSANIIMSLTLLSGCGQAEEETALSPTPTAVINETVTAETTPATEQNVTATPSPSPTATPTPTVDPYLGKKQNMLNGEWIDETEVEHRPLAVMFNNLKIASPQSGIGQADIVYEALAEGGITRLMGIFSKIDPESPAAFRLGSVRSSRHYYVSFADEYDAIYIHFGETTYATKKMKAIGIDHISGMYGAGEAAFFRDKTIKAPHNAFATLEGLNKAIEKYKIRTEYEEGFAGHFSFYKEDTTPGSVLTNAEDNQAEVSQVAENSVADASQTEQGKEAVSITGDVLPEKIEQITLDFSNYTKPYFIYDEQRKEYLRFQFGAEHIDYNTNEPLYFKNILIQLVDEWDIDKNGYQTMDIENSTGTGWYLTNGILQKITWEKNESNRFMRYYDGQGQDLCINPGKTFIAVFPVKREAKITVK